MKLLGLALAAFVYLWAYLIAAQVAFALVSVAFAGWRFWWWPRLTLWITFSPELLFALLLVLGLLALALTPKGGML